MRRVALIIFISLTTTFAAGQNFEVTGLIGQQFNGGVDLSTSLFRRIEVKNGLTYGVGAGFLLGDRFGAEFMWSYNKADTVAQPVGGGTDRKVFVLDTNRYFGNFLIHFASREKAMRPFVLVGAGVNNLAPARTGVTANNQFSWALGGGVKYFFHPHIGVRVQGKWSPTYLTTTPGGYWCDPFWGGCWVVGNDHYLHEFDFSGGITLRF